MVSGRYLFFNNLSLSNIPGGLMTTDRATDFHDRMDSAAVQAVTTIGNSRLNELRLQYARRHQFRTIGTGVDGPAVTVSGVAGFGALWAIAFAYRHFRGREGLGGGDPKLLGAIGLWLGWRMLPPVLLAASLLGLAVVLIRMLRGHTVRASDAVPLGVLLAAAAYPAWLLMVEGGP